MRLLFSYSDVKQEPLNSKSLFTFKIDPPIILTGNDWMVDVLTIDLGYDYFHEKAILLLSDLVDLTWKNNNYINLLAVVHKSASFIPGEKSFKVAKTFLDEISFTLKAHDGTALSKLPTDINILIDIHKPSSKDLYQKVTPDLEEIK